MEKELEKLQEEYDDAPIAVAENVAEKINTLAGDKLIWMNK